MVIGQFPTEDGGTICLFGCVVCPDTEGGSVFDTCNSPATCDGGQCSATISTGTGISFDVEDEGEPPGPGDAVPASFVNAAAQAARAAVAATIKRKLFSNRANLPVRKMTNAVAVPADLTQPLPFGRNGYVFRYAAGVFIDRPGPGGREYYALYRAAREPAVPDVKPLYVGFRVASEIPGAVRARKATRLEPQSSGAVRELALEHRFRNSTQSFHVFGAETIP
jgi:hypothetical protein